MNDKSRWMRFFMDNGVYDLGQMKEQYNSFQTGGFMDRLKSAMGKSSHPQVVYWDKVGKTDFNEPQIEFGGSDGFGGAGSYGEWGDVDYVRNTPIPPVLETFNDAFARARKAGQATFWFDGKLYNTEIDPNYKSNPRAENRTQMLTLPMNQRDVFTNKGVQLQDSTRVEPYYGQIPGWIERETIDDKVKETYIGPEPKWPNEYKSGGSIHIKHPGRLTALKKRTGKTEAELWATGNKDYRRMITFARNSRKWKHQDGGYLDDIIWDNMGQWSHPGRITGITGTKNGTDITMNGVADYLIGKDNLGNVKFMKPGRNYHFPGSSVVEYPLKYQFGGLFKKKPQVNYLYSTYGLNDYGQPRYDGSYDNPVFGYQPLSGINQSIGRDYSMPDYSTAAIVKTPMYMVEKPESNIDKAVLAKKFAADFILQDGIENTMNSKYYDKKLDRWIPQDSVEGGAKTIGKGLKMNNTNANWYKILNKQGYLTNAQMEAGVLEMVDKFYDRARKTYDNRIGAGSFDQLDPNKRAILIDYAYNGVLNKFNNFMDAVAADDKEKILNNYTRYTGGKKLGKRNDETLNWINSIWPDTYQYGGLIKPFSYTDIPVVRYGFGGYSYI